MVIESLNRLGRSKSKFETNVMELVNGFTTQIQSLRDAITRNNKSAEAVADTVAKIFREAQAQLQQIQEETVTSLPQQKPEVLVEKL